MLRYYDDQQLPDGTITRVQKARKLVEAIGEYRTKTAARTLAEEQLEPVNASRTTPQSVMSLERFVDSHYLPFVESHKKISTYDGYRKMWTCYLKHRAKARSATSGRRNRAHSGNDCPGEQLDVHDPTAYQGVSLRRVPVCKEARRDPIRKPRARCGDPEGEN